MFAFIKSLFTSKARGEAVEPEPSEAEHALIIDTREPTISIEEVYALEDALTAALESDGVGDVDGHEIATDGSHAIIYMYGADANKMFASALPILRAQRISASGFARLRFGAADDPAVREEYLEISKVENPH